ncbi:DDB1- and CUL4-associated factor 4 [Rhinophrynus dorsalis]
MKLAAHQETRATSYRGTDVAKELQGRAQETGRPQMPGGRLCRYESDPPQASSSSTATIPQEHSPPINDSQTTSVPELPGFYYDPEKNRYFRLLPGHNNCNPLTRESLEQKEMEAKRLRLLEEEKHRKKSTRSGLNASLLLWERKLGMMPFATYCRRVHELKVSCLQRREVYIESPEPVGAGTHRFEFIMADSSFKRLFAVNDVENGFCKYGLLNMNGLWRELPTVESYDNPYFTSQKVNAACWASLTSPDSHVVVCRLGRTDDPGCVSLIPASLFRNMEPNSDDGRPEILYNLRVANAWTCAWCSNPQLEMSYSAGLSRQVLVVNAVTNVRRTFRTRSDVLTQQFASQSLVLYNGCRSGEVFSIDLRAPANSRAKFKKVLSFSQSFGITCLRLLKDENYLMVSDMTGQIKLWDVRMVKCVKRYEGHQNSYAVLPLHVKEDEGLLLAVGQDCYTRIWDLQDTRLLRTIPSPHPASKESIPSVVFSPYLGGKGQMVPGLIMAVNKDLYHFSYDSSALRYVF